MEFMIGLTIVIAHFLAGALVARSMYWKNKEDADILPFVILGGFISLLVILTILFIKTPPKRIRVARKKRAREEQQRAERKELIRLARENDIRLPEEWEV